MANDQIEVQVELEAEPGSENVVVEQQPLKVDGSDKTPAAGDDPIKALKAQYDDLKAKDEQREKARQDSIRREQEARADADRHAREAAEVRTRMADTSFQSVENAISATDNEIQVAKRDYIAAQELGDHAKAADAHERVAAASAKKAGLERDKVAYDQERKRQTVVVDRSASQQDPLASFTPESRAWLIAHPECMTNTQKRETMLEAHRLATSPSINLTPDTPEYFAFVERSLGYEPAARSAQEQPAQSQRSRTMPSAPPSREPAAAPGNKVSVTLSPGERRAAEDGTLIWNSGPNKGKPIGIQEMARRKSQLERDGKYKNISVN